MQDNDRLVESLVRLRRLARLTTGDIREELAASAHGLEELAGPTIGRARAARLLGISQTALERWVERGDIASVITPRGRRELHLPSFVDLLIDVRACRESGSLRPVARILGERRARARDVAQRIVVGTDLQGHARAEAMSLAYHTLVAERLDDDLVEAARARLRRWITADSIHPRVADDWAAVLDLSLPEVATCLTSTHEAAIELRQSSPFAGSLGEAERLELLALVNASARTHAA